MFLQLRWGFGNNEPAEGRFSVLCSAPHNADLQTSSFRPKQFFQLALRNFLVNIGIGQAFAARDFSPLIGPSTLLLYKSAFMM